MVRAHSGTDPGKGEGGGGGGMDRGSAIRGAFELNQDEFVAAVSILLLSRPGMHLAGLSAEVVLRLGYLDDGTPPRPLTSDYSDPR